MGRFCAFLVSCLILGLGLGCGMTPREQGEATPAGVDGPYAGAGGMPAVEREKIERETAEQKAEGAFAEAERGAGADDDDRHAGLGGLFYFYVGLGILLFLYLVWLIWAKPHRHDQPVVRVK